MTGDSGIRALMDDLGAALSSKKKMIMLGGGNPADIPEIQQHFRSEMYSLLENGRQFEDTISSYGGPEGYLPFREALAEMMREEYKWDITEKNIAITNGSQSGFFVLFNFLAGRFNDGSFKKILLPLAPEYIGYSDVGIDGSEGLFKSFKPKIENIDELLFKYHIDFDAVKPDENTSAICVSRPTNPTGNVLTDSEIHKLSALAKDNGIPLIIDNAYGTPFPHIIFDDVKPYYNDNTIVCMSLSKLGLPGTRCGIIIASEQTIRSISMAGSIMNLAPCSLGPALATRLVKSREIIRLSREIVAPFYKKKADRVVAMLTEQMKDIPLAIHKPEGAFFLWLRFKGLPVSSQTLYEKLKENGVLVIPGHYFFPGFDAQWQHQTQCIRLNYAADENTLKAGIEILTKTVRKIYR